MFKRLLVDNQENGDEGRWMQKQGFIFVSNFVIPLQRILYMQKMERSKDTLIVMEHDGGRGQIIVKESLDDIRSLMMQAGAGCG